MNENPDSTGTEPNDVESVLETPTENALIDTNIGAGITNIEPSTERILTIVDEIEMEIGNLKRNSMEMDPIMFQGEWPLATRSIGQKIRKALKPGSGFTKDDLKMHVEELDDFMKGVDNSGILGHQICVLHNSLPKPEKRGLPRFYSQ